MSKIRRFVSCWFAWTCFSSALVTLFASACRYVQGGYLGWWQEAFVCVYSALCFTIWRMLIFNNNEN